MNARIAPFSACCLLCATTIAQFTEHIIDSVDVVAPRGVAAADLDGDGDQDVVVMSYESTGFPSTDSKLCWYANNGSGAFGPRQVIDSMPTAEQPELADVDGDGDTDILAAWDWGEEIRLYLNDGTGVFTQVTTPIASLFSVYHYGFLAADVSGDGKADALMGTDAIDLSWALNDGAGTFSPPQMLAPSIGDPLSLRTCDVEGDGDLDVLFAGFASGGAPEASWLENLGGGTFGAVHVIADPVSYGMFRNLECKDLDGDTDPDAVYVSSGSLKWKENDGTDFDTEHWIAGSSGTITRLRSADLDGDGDNDLLAARLTEETIDWYANDGTGNFAAAQMITATCDSVWWITTADMNGDGVEDVISTAMRGSAVSWYELQGLSTGQTGYPMSDVGFTIQPNPFTTTALLASDAPITADQVVELLDATGRPLQLWRGTGARGMTIDRGGLASGVYTVRILRGNGATPCVRLIAE